MQHRPVQPERLTRVVSANRRAGFTVVELLVSMAILAVLVALILPAVQQSRAAASRVTCSAHLHQIGIAVESYVSSNRQLPYTHQGAGLLFSILPYLEQSAEYERLAPLLIGDVTAFSEAFSTSAKFEFYRCPVDPYAVYPGASSYNVNGGLMPVVGWGNAFVPDREPFLTWSHVTDGLSQTALCSEMRTPPPTPMGSPIAPQYGQWEVSFTAATPHTITLPEIDQFVQECLETSQTSPPPLPAPAYAYYVPNAGYNHVGPPNGPVCNSIDLLRNLAQSRPASSNHTAGVNVLMADGAVRFAASNIDLHVWRAVGSRNGGETEANSF